MKLFFVTLFFCFNAFAYSPEVTAEKSCSNIGLQYLFEHIKEFQNKKDNLNSTYNYNLKKLGIREIAFASPTTVLTPEFDKLYFSLTTKKDADLTKLEIPFKEARPAYAKKCQELMLSAYKTCKVDVTKKEAPEAQKACMRNNTGKLQTIIKELQYNPFDDEYKASSKEKVIWGLVEKKKPASEIIKHIKERQKYNSHQRAFLTQLLYYTVKVNHVEMIDYVMSGLNVPGNKEVVMASFFDKNSITMMTLGNKDLKYFEALVKAGWLSDKEKKLLSEKSKDPEVLKFLK
jgi:hypothetical protein